MRDIGDNILRQLIGNLVALTVDEADRVKMIQRNSNMTLGKRDGTINGN